MSARFTSYPDQHRRADPPGAAVGWVRDRYAVSDGPVTAAFASWTRCCTESGWVAALPVEEVPITGATGRTLADAVRARWSSPADDLAAMDGIAVSAASTAGVSPGRPVRLPDGAFDVVDTGDPIPPARDAVVMRERVRDLEDGSVEVAEPVPAGRHVRRAGEDITAGEQLLPAGHRLRPVDLAVLAAAGHARVRVRARPRVAVIPTGDEIRSVGAEIARGEIIDTNSPMLAAIADEAGCAATAYPVVPDDPAALAAVLRAAAAAADLVLLIAGSSAGRADHAAAAIATVGRVAVHGVAIRPGHPVLLGVLADAGRAVPLIGVPGYPLAATHVTERFALPLVELLLGAAPRPREQVVARLAGDVSTPSGVDRVLPVRLATGADGALVALSGDRGSAALSTLMRADGLLRIPAGTGDLPAGRAVVIELLGGAPPAIDRPARCGSPRSAPHAEMPWKESVPAT